MEAYNSVNKGLNKDFDPNIQPEGTYVHSLNGRIISKGNGNYSWENVRGTTLSFSLNDNYPIIGGCAFRDKLIIFSVYGVIGEIGEVIVDKDGIGSYYPKYVHSGLNFSIDHPIGNECYGYYENTYKQRLYWTDDYNNLRSINLADLTYITSGDIVSGTTYMVVEGSVTYDAVLYLKGQTFVGTATTTFTPSTSNSYVVKYIPYQTLDVVPVTSLGIIEFDSIIAGSLNCGKYSYSYRLISSNDIATDWYPLTLPVHITDKSALGLSTYQLYQGGSPTINSARGIRLVINNVDTNFQNIEVVAFYSDAQDVFADGKIFYQGAITGANMVIDHLAEGTFGIVTLDEASVISISIERVKTIANLKQIASIANIRERDEFSVDITATIATEGYQLVSDTLEVPWGDIYRTSGTTDPITGHDVDLYNVVLATGVTVYVYPFQNYKIETGIFTYSGVDYGPAEVAGQYFIGAVGTYSGVTASDGTEIIPVIRVKTFIDNTSTQQYKYIEIKDSYLDYKGNTVDKNCVGYWGEETYRFGFMAFKNGRPYFVRWLKDHTFSSRKPISFDGTAEPMVYNYPAYPLVAKYSNLNVLTAVISNLDLTDIIDDIDGFSIVRAKRQPQILSEGALTALTKYTDVTQDAYLYTGLTEYFAHADGTSLLDGYRQKMLYVYYSPEHMFDPLGSGNLSDVVIPAPESTDKLSILTYLYPTKINNPAADPYSALGDNETTNYHPYQKFYRPTERLSGNGCVIDAYNRITFWELAGFGEAIISVCGSGVTLRNRSDISIARFGVGERGTVIYMSAAETTAATYRYGFGDYDSNLAGGTYDWPLLTYIKHVRPVTNIYGGTSPAALAATEYMWCGHYQPINSTVKAQVINGSGKYIFNHVQVFGGDCYVNLYDVARLVKDSYEEDSGGQPQVSHAIVFPVQSTINVAMRRGRHIAKDRSWEYQTPTTYHPNGIHYDRTFATVDQRTCQFVYYGTYSSLDNGQRFLALPVSHQFASEFDVRHRWSNVKTNGEEIDNFMKFEVDKYRDVEAAAGSITNIRSKAGRLYYWQEKAVGYMPINERTMYNDPIGAAVQLGIGGTYERFDEANNFFGNQHKHCLCETQKGFAWFDFNKRAFINMGVDFGITEDSIISGLQQYFNNELDSDLKYWDNPYIGMGIASGYNPRYREVIMSFKYLSQTFSVTSTPSVGATYTQYSSIVKYSSVSYLCVNTHVYATFIPANWVAISIKSKWVQDKYYSVGNLVWEDSYTTLYIAIRNHSSLTKPSQDTTNWKSYPRAAFTFTAGTIKDIIIGFNEMINAFQSFYSYRPAYFFNLRNYLFTGVEGDTRGFLNDAGDYGIFHSSTTPANSELQIIVNKDFEIRKVFDNFELIGNNYFFKEIYYENSEQSGSDLSITNSSGVLVSEDFEYRNKAWIGSIPFDSTGNRFRGEGYLKIKYVFDNVVNKLVKFLSLKTIYRQTR